jgi:hypothetical protein
MKRITTLITGLAVATMLTAGPVSAQAQRGLVNVNISDVIDGDVLSDIDVNVGVALNIAANVCGVAVGVLASQLGQTGAAQCDVGNQTVTLTRLIND